MNISLQDKVAVVTGGGQGIGRGITEKLLSVGAKVMVAQRQPLDDSLIAEDNVAYIEADLLKLEAPEKIASAVQSHFGGADILINNAGFMFERHIEELDEASWDQMMIVNMRAPVFIAKALLPQMRQRGGGSIINIGSIEGIGANPLHAAYCASKAGMHGFTRALAVDLGKEGIRCNAIAPGWINSKLSNDYINSQANPSQAWEDLHAMHPVGRIGVPNDIGAAAVFLASDESAFLTGQVIVVDGGRTAKLPLPF